MSEALVNDPRGELAELAACARALVEWHEATGGDGLPSDQSAVDAFALLDPPAVGRRAARGAAPSRAGGGVGAPAQPPFAHSARSTSSEVNPGRPGPLPPVTAPPVPPVPALPVPALPVSAPPVSAPMAPALPLVERAQRLRVLAEEVRGCSRCGLAEKRTQTVYARGNPSADLCFIGEGPGADEDRQGQPFVGKAGQLLDKMIAAMGYGPDDVYVCNVVKCRPPDNRKPEPGEMAACLPHLHEQLTIVQPKVIVALGGTAVQGLLGAAEGITRMRGTWKLYRGTIPVMPTFHPAYLLRDGSKKAEVWSDLQAVMKQLGKPLPKRG